MRDPRTESVIAAISARYPDTRIEVRPNPDPDTASMPDFIVVLDVPPSRIREVEDFGLDVAFAAYGDEPLPFLLGAVDPERSARYFPARAVEGQVSEP